MQLKINLVGFLWACTTELVYIIVELFAVCGLELTTLGCFTMSETVTLVKVSKELGNVVDSTDLCID